MPKSTPHPRWLLLLAAPLALATLMCRTPTEESQIATQIADLEATRAALSTEVADLQGRLTDDSDATTAGDAPTATRVPPTTTPTETFTPTPPPPTSTPVLPELLLALVGCNTGLDVAHSLGEVTNAYVRVQNVGGADATDVCLRLRASDEGEAHPDQTRCVPRLPAQTEVTLKLTVDTEYRTDTSVAVYLTSLQGIAAAVRGDSCEELDLPLLREVEAELDIVVPLSAD